MRGADECDGCDGQSVNPWYLMRPQQDDPDQIKAVYCEGCAEKIENGEMISDA